jgi:formate dehydrogenase subunit beta
VKFKGAILPAEDNLDAVLIPWLKEAMTKGVFDSLLIPVKVPAGDSYTYLLLQDPALLENASVLPPVMPVQGGKVISRLTMRGNGNKRIAAIVRPCEARAAIELMKLKQAHLENIYIITMDCPGVMPQGDFLEDPVANLRRFKEASYNWDREPMRPACQICDHFSVLEMLASDLHIATLASPEGNFPIIPLSPEGERILEKLNMPLGASLDGWLERVEDIKQVQVERRHQAHAELGQVMNSPDSMLALFSSCINCHNCQRVCPLCYCRQCYFDSGALKLPPENYIARAERKGALRFPPDTLLFHIGRASHMALSCVSCGACEDACPMDIPVSQIFSLAADKSQGIIGYVPGENRDEILPLATYEIDELHQVEQAYIETYQNQEVRDA